jgi:hypothetical protein
MHSDFSISSPILDRRTTTVGATKVRHQMTIVKQKHQGIESNDGQHY